MVYEISWIVVYQAMSVIGSDLTYTLLMLLNNYIHFLQLNKLTLEMKENFNIEKYYLLYTETVILFNIVLHGIKN